MGFGLHVGWAIEGAIGSEYKIDASYLSPNVNMASRLEAATKQFGTTILLSEDFVCMLSPFVRSRVRQIDCVTVKVICDKPCLPVSELARREKFSHPAFTCEKDKITISSRPESLSLPHIHSIAIAIAVENGSMSS